MGAMALAIEALNLAEAGWKLFQKLKDDFKQTGELTPDQERALDARAAQMFAQPHWQPEKPSQRID